RSDDRGDPRAQPRIDCCRRQKVRLRNFPAAKAKTLRKQPDGKVLVTDGPYTETKEHMGGFWILEAANLDEALAWAKKAAIACDIPREGGELLFYPDPEERPGGGE